MMEAYWVEVAKQVPALLVLVYVVGVFLKHITEMGSRFEGVNIKLMGELSEIHKSAKEHQRELTKEHQVVMKEMAAVIERNSEKLGRNAAIFGEHSREKNGLKREIG